MPRGLMLSGEVNRPLFLRPLRSGRRTRACEMLVDFGGVVEVGCHLIGSFVSLIYDDFFHLFFSLFTTIRHHLI